MSSCKMKYSPAEFIAIMAIGFVEGNLPPSIDEHGKPVYVIQNVSKDVIGSGCAATLVIQATANKKFMKSLSALGAHESCAINGMPSKGINIWDIVEFPHMPFVMCYCGRTPGNMNPGCGGGCAKTRDNCIQFFQDLQTCHDTAAIWYYTGFTHGLHQDTCVQVFRRIVLAELKKVAAKYGITWPEVEVGIVTLSAPLAVRIPAIKAMTFADAAASL